MVGGSRRRGERRERPKRGEEGKACHAKGAVLTPVIGDDDSEDSAMTNLANKRTETLPGVVRPTELAS